MVAVGIGIAIYRPSHEYLESGTFNAIALVVQHGAMAVAAAWCLGAFGTRRVRDALGIIPVRPKEFGIAIGLALVLVAFAAGITHIIERNVHHETPIGKLLERVPVRYAIGFGALLAPVSEELFFRGVLVPAFGRVHIAIGVVASAVIFTAVHALQLEGAWLGLLPIAAVGLVNGWLRARSGGITQSWIVHTVYNATLSAAIYRG
jgi:membrane protease YdiL (CAAX protease family)